MTTIAETTPDALERLSQEIAQMSRAAPHHAPELAVAADVIAEIRAAPPSCPFEHGTLHARLTDAQIETGVRYAYVRPSNPRYQLGCCVARLLALTEATLHRASREGYHGNDRALLGDARNAELAAGWYAQRAA